MISLQSRIMMNMSSIVTMRLMMSFLMEKSNSLSKNLKLLKIKINLRTNKLMLLKTNQSNSKYFNNLLKS